MDAIKFLIAIGFNMGNFCEDLLQKNNSKIDIVFTIDKTVRDGRSFRNSN